VPDHQPAQAALARPVVQVSDDVGQLTVQLCRRRVAVAGSSSAGQLAAPAVSNSAGGSSSACPLVSRCPRCPTGSGPSRGGQVQLGRLARGARGLQQHRRRVAATGPTRPARSRRPLCPARPALSRGDEVQLDRHAGDARVARTIPRAHREHYSNSCHCSITV
jgi:hypothetical protein